MKKYHSKEQIIGLKLLKRHNSINLKTGAYILEYSPQFKPIFLGKGIKEIVKVACLFWGHITHMHTCCYQTLVNTQVSFPPLSWYFTNFSVPAY